MADEQGQAVEQPAPAISAPELTANEAVAQLSEAIQKAEQGPSRDEKTGKFAPKENEEAPDEAKAEEAPEEEAAPEEAPPPRKLKIKYKGEDKEVDEPEAVELAQKGYDYTQKMQQLSKERDEHSAKVKTEREAAAKQYADHLEVHKKALLQVAKVKTMAEIEEMSRTGDPVAAQTEFLRALSVNQTIAGIEAEQARIRNEQQTEFQSNLKKQAETAVETLQAKIPGWSNDLYGKVLKSAVKEYGFQQPEVNAITDHRAIEVLHDAMKWREFQAAKPKTLDKKVATVPKVQKPGTSEKPDPKAQELTASFDKLTKTGSRQDAEAHVLALLKAGRI